MVEDISSRKITYECHFCIHASKINDEKPFWTDFVEHLLECDHFRSDGINLDKERVTYAEYIGE